ncbi:lysophospholipid acyltransferase family protein [Neptunicella marina]|uniref:Lysophospholipid acyltransferase family protein n=1 Tax=Neptunicella marina TaxID=2125989 RepID=A0A8J6IVM5_9ALTE|nr:lysophospholipid acyltransferase family protein [Neptunicella marina]MBC3766421.1 lysophospholipid acyltransferase family protein [Neptunicella marina]
MSLNIEALNIPAQNPRWQSRIMYWLGCGVLKMMGWRFEGQFPQHKKFVAAVAPHTSNWDFVVGMASVFALRLKLAFMAKSSLFVWPFAGLLRFLGGIAIERSRSHGVVTQLSEKFADSDFLMLALAPEGTRSKVTEWKSGFLKIAYQANVPVQLIYFDYAKKVVGFGPCFAVSDDWDAEMQKVQQFFAGVTAKFPEKC